jgi:hypothetical protein
MVGSALRTALATSDAAFPDMMWFELDKDAEENQRVGQTLCFERTCSRQGNLMSWLCMTGL